VAGNSQDTQDREEGKVMIPTMDVCVLPTSRLHLLAWSFFERGITRRMCYGGPIVQFRVGPARQHIRISTLARCLCHR